MSTKDLIGQAAERKYTEFDIKAKEMLLQKLDTQLTASGHYDKLASARNVNEETLIEGKKVTIGVDYIHDGGEDNHKFLKKEFKINIKVTGDTTADLTGSPKNLKKYLTSEYYDMDIEDVKELFPELF